MVLEGISHMAKLNTCPMHRIPNTLTTIGVDTESTFWHNLWQIVQELYCNFHKKPHFAGSVSGLKNKTQDDLKTYPAHVLPAHVLP